MCGAVSLTASERIHKDTYGTRYSVHAHDLITLCKYKTLTIKAYACVLLSRRHD